MAPFDGIAGVWKNLQELDLRPIRDLAEKEVRLAIVGREGSGRHELAAQMVTDRSPSKIPSRLPILVTTLEEADADRADAPGRDAGRVRDADLIVLVVGPAEQDDERARALAHIWNAAGKKLLVYHNQATAEPNAADLPRWMGWAPARVVAGQN